jgi:hypothetical protein
LHICKQKTKVLVYFGGRWNGTCWAFLGIWHILQLFGIFYARLVYFLPFWYIAPRQIWQTFSVVPPTRRNYFDFIFECNNGSMYNGISTFFPLKNKDD